jgi:hypothetical protein
MEDVFFRMFRPENTPKTLEHSLNAPFTYLDPGFFGSDDYAATERLLWTGVRRLRAALDDTYWAALKTNGIVFNELDFGETWQLAHHVYGLGIATADFVAIREALAYLRVLYIYRKADFALLLDQLAEDYSKLASAVSHITDSEARYLPAIDPMKVTTTIGNALELGKAASAAVGQMALLEADYLYQASVICALRSVDTSAHDRLMSIAMLLREWAALQKSMGREAWARINYSFAAKLSEQSRSVRGGGRTRRFASWFRQ